MKSTNNTIVIGVDHGYQNIKTAHAIFKSGVTTYDKEPTSKRMTAIFYKSGS